MKKSYIPIFLSKMEGPNQPTDIKFPKRKFGIKNPEERSFNPQWFTLHHWLHYDVEGDRAFCYVCMGAKTNGRIGNTKTNATYTTVGFTNWKDATKKFRAHETSESHLEAVERHVTLPKVTRDIGEMLSSAHRQEKAENRAKLLQIIRSIRYLSRQGIALRGHDDGESNFIQLLKHHGENDPSLLKWIEKKQDKFTSPAF